MKSKEVIKILPPGGELTVAEVTDRHKAEYAEQYAAFKAGQEQPIEGTPLEQWSMLSRGLCTEFKALGLRTVEQLAEANDNVKRKMKAQDKWCKTAKEWLKEAKAPQTQVVALKAQVDDLTLKLNQALDQIEMLHQRIESTEGNAMSSRLTRLIKGG